MKDLEMKTLSEHKYFNVIELDGQVGVIMNRISVAIMPYTVDEHGMISHVGLLKEYNPFRDGDFAQTLITGTIENSDDSLLYTAKRELTEEAGFTIPESENQRWIFLGTFFTYKDTDRQVPTFAVDVTGLTQLEPKTDGSKKENLSKLEMVTANLALATDEALPLAAFLRLFNYFYLKTIGHA